MKDLTLEVSQSASVEGIDDRYKVLQNHKEILFHDLRNSISVLKNNIGFMTDGHDLLLEFVQSAMAIFDRLQATSDVQKDWSDIEVMMKEIFKNKQRLFHVEETGSALQDCQNDIQRIEDLLKIIEKL